MNDFVVYTRKMAEALVALGFAIKGAGVNNRNPIYPIYYFENTPELREAVKKISKSPQ